MAFSVEEEESIEAIKKWWQETGKSLAIGLAAAAVLFFAWQQWQNRSMRSSAAASAIYEQLSTAVLTAPGETLGDDQRQQAFMLSETLKTDHDDSIYALYGALFAARVAVEAGDLERGEQELRWLLDNVSSGFFSRTDESLVLTAQLRLARVLFAQGDAEQALALIAGVDPKGFAGEYAELRGDIHMSMGQTTEAQSAWQEAAQLNPDSPALQMKLNNLPSGS